MNSEIVLRNGIVILRYVEYICIMKCYSCKSENKVKASFTRCLQQM